MKTKTIVGIVVAAAVVASAVFFGNTKFQKGSLGGLTSTSSGNLNKLYFQWVTPSAAALTTGIQVEVARFNLSSNRGPSNAAFVARIPSLNFLNLSDATLTNFTLFDVTLNAQVATNANSSNFNSSVSGGNMNSIILVPEEGRTFKILADVSTNKGSQFTQFQFDVVANMNLPEKATWDETSSSDTAMSVLATWELSSWNRSALSEILLTAASSASDTTAPALQEIRLINKGVPGTLEIGDSIDLVFSEKLNPITINQNLTYGNTVNSVSVGATGTVTSKQDPTNSSLTFQIANIASFDLKQQASKPVKAPSTFGIKGFGKKSPQFGILIPPTTVSALPDPLKDALVDISINQAGHTVQLTFVGFNEKGNNVGYNLLQPEVGYSIAGTVKDTAGNILASGKTKVTGSW